MQESEVKSFKIEFLFEDRIMVKPSNPESRTPGGIIIPGTVEQEITTGEIVMVGKGSEDHPVKVAVGDKVLHNKYGGLEYTEDGVKYLIMRQMDVLATLKKDN